jgi:hypothetical protein
MAISTIDKELIKYFAQMDEPQKKSLLEMIKTFLGSDHEAMESVSIEQYNRELDEAMERISKGQFTTLEELEKEMKTW